MRCGRVRVALPGTAGHVLGTSHRLPDKFTAYVPSRPHLEWQIRRRTKAIENVEFVRASVARPSFDTARRRVTGVTLDTGDAIPADLVVDAAGRGARLPVWLQEWGFDRPPEHSVDVGIGYATHQLRIPAGLTTEKVVTAGASREQPCGLGVLFYEDGTWGLTTFGVSKAIPLRDPAVRRSGTAPRPGPRPWWYGPVGGLFDQFLGATETDPVLAEWFLRRFSLLDSLYMVPSTWLVGRTIGHNMRLWLSERRANAPSRDRDRAPSR